MQKQQKFELRCLVLILALFSVGLQAADYRVHVSRKSYTEAGANAGFFLGHFDLAPTLADCTEVAPGKLFRGGEPLFSRSVQMGNPSDVAVQTLIENKIDLVVDARSENPSKRQLAKEILEKHGIRYLHLPMYTAVPRGQTLDGLNNPTYLAKVNAALEIVLKELGQKKNIYIHCQRGEDRSGTFIALLRKAREAQCVSWNQEFRSYGGVMYAPLKDLFTKLGKKASN